jgi:hypothetical protein
MLIKMIAGRATNISALGWETIEGDEITIEGIVNAAPPMRR